jgi:hypothetical protein
MPQIPLERDSILSAGVHSFVIKEVKEAVGKESGSPYLKIQYICIDAGPEAKKSVYGNLSLTPQSRWIVDQFLDAVGFPSTGTIDTASFVGKKLRARVVHTEFNGKTKAELSIFIPAGSNVAEHSPEADKKPAQQSAPAKKVGLPSDFFEETKEVGSDAPPF